MPCTTILVGKKASHDGSTIIARNDDGGFEAKRLLAHPAREEASTYKTVISHLTVELPGNALRYTDCPNVSTANGVWPACGINEANVAMTATETITSNARVIGADPYVRYQKKKNRNAKEIPGGIGEEGLVTLVLPYIHSAREGVLRTGALLEQYGTYEPNGMAFADAGEVWWLETIGGHHWIARRVPDDAYVVMPNQFGIDAFDLEDALTEQKEHMCSADLKEFIEKNHLDLSQDGSFSARDAFGSHDDSDHVYNTARAWYMLRTLNPRTKIWDGPNAEYTPFSDDLPWCMVPEKKITVEDVKYVLSSHYQGTPYDPYAAYGDKSMRGAYRSIGINRNDVLTLIQMRPEGEPVQWLALASNAFNVLAPFYTGIDRTPEYLSATTGKVSTENFYWMSRMIAAMADASYNKSVFHIERYQEKVAAKSHVILNHYDALLAQENDEGKCKKLQEEANEKTAQMLREAAADTLDKVLYELSGQMKNAYARSDA